MAEEDLSEELPKVVQDEVENEPNETPPNMEQRGSKEDTPPPSEPE